MIYNQKLTSANIKKKKKKKMIKHLMKKTYSYYSHVMRTPVYLHMRKQGQKKLALASNIFACKYSTCIYMCVSLFIL